MKRARTLIVAETASQRAGLTALLREEETLHLCGEAAPRPESLLAALLLNPCDAVLLDATGSGPEVLATTIAALEARWPHPALVVLGDAPARDLPKLTEAHALPGWGYLRRDKGDGKGQLAAALVAAAQGIVVLDRHLRPGPAPRPAPPESPLTDRERQVLTLLADGLPNKQIAFKLGITPHTAKFHVAQILHKLNAESRTEAVTRGARLGLLTL